MRYRIPIQYLLIITHLSVFIFTALFTGFSTYFIVNRPKISEKVSAQKQKQEEYLIYERREALALRPNGHHKVRVTGFAQNLKSGEEHIVYSFIDDPYQRKFQRTVPTATLLNNGHIFLNGVSDFGFAVLDISGNNLTADYRDALAHRDFPLSQMLFSPKDGIIFTYRGDNSKEKYTRHKIYWKKNDGMISTIDDPIFPSGDFWLKPIGWSFVSPLDFYVSRETSAAAAASAKLWRVSLKEKKVRELASVSGAMHTDMRVCSEQDYAVFISGATDPTQGAFGTTVPPSRIMVSNLFEDMTTEIASSQGLFTNLFVSCESRKILVKEGGAFRLFSTDGKELPQPAFKGKLLFFSGTGETVVTKYDSKFLIENLVDGTQREIGEEMGYTIIGLNSQ